MRHVDRHNATKKEPSDKLWRPFVSDDMNRCAACELELPIDDERFLCKSCERELDGPERRIIETTPVEQSYGYRYAALVALGVDDKLAERRAKRFCRRFGAKTIDRPAHSGCHGARILRQKSILHPDRDDLVCEDCGKVLGAGR